jgi:hypothetical protein
MKKSISILFLLMLTSWISQAQFQGKVYEPFNAVILNINGQPMINPFMGGLNSTYCNKVDLNKDNKQDLVVHDFMTDRVYIFLNTANGTNLKYEYAPQYQNIFPPIYGYLILKDINCDNIPDLFHQGSTGVAIYNGKYIGNTLQFVFNRELFVPGTNGPVNVYVNTADVPIIEDVDNDGDLDILAMHVIASYINLYKNMRVERGLPCDSLEFVEVGGCYGKAIQSNTWMEWILNANCKGTDPAGEIAKNLTDADFTDLMGNPISSKTKKKLRHGNNSLVSIDLDGDNDKDVLGGNSIYKQIQALYKSSPSNTAPFNAIDTVYKDIVNGIYPTPQYLDIDNDGLKDLIVAPRVENKQSQYSLNNAMLFYKNTGTITSPNFSKSAINPLFDEMLDVGINSHPALYDYDNDGKIDIFIGHTGTPDTNYLPVGGITYLKNISTKGDLKFEVVTHDFLNLSSKNYKGAYPTFGNVIGSEAKDLIISNDSGKYTVYENIASTDQNPPNYVWITDNFLNINFGSYTSCTMFDINKDGFEDFVYSNIFGGLYVAINKGNLATPSFNTPFNIKNLRVGDPGGYAYAAVTTAIVDSFGKKQLLVGNNDGLLERYDDFILNASNDSVVSFTKLDSNYSFIFTEGRSVPAVADLDGDGRRELLLGNRLGGLKIFEQSLLLNDTIPQIPIAIKEPSKNQFKLYPNPAKNIIAVEAVENGKHTIIEFYNILGQKIISKPIEHKITTINISQLSNGLYTYHIKNSNYFEKGIIQKQ